MASVDGDDLKILEGFLDPLFQFDDDVAPRKGEADIEALGDGIRDDFV